MCACVHVCSVMSDSLRPHGLQARQAPLSMEFPRQEYWNGLPFSPRGDLPDPGIQPVSPESPALAGGFFTTELPGKPLFNFRNNFFYILVLFMWHRHLFLLFLNFYYGQFQKYKFRWNNVVIPHILQIQLKLLSTHSQPFSSFIPFLTTYHFKKQIPTTRGKLLSSLTCT